MQGRVAHARMRHDVQPVSPELILAAQLGSKSAGLHVGIAHAERGGQIHVQAVAADAVAHGSKDVQAVAVPASVQVGTAEVVVVIRRGNGALAFRTAGSAVHGKAHAEHAAAERADFGIGANGEAAVIADNGIVRNVHAVSVDIAIHGRGPHIGAILVDGVAGIEVSERHMMKDGI